MDINKIKRNLVFEEGLKLMPYTCTAGKLTIGVGRNIEDRGISEDTAMQMLEEDIDIILGELKVAIKHFDEYPEDVQFTLVDLAFNLGLPKLLTFTLTLKYLEEGLQTGNYTKAAVELMNSAYAKQVPNRARRNHDRIFNA